MEDARHSEPHRRPIHYKEVLMSVIVAMAVLVIIVELSGGAEWFTVRSGWVHLVAVGFAALAAGRLFSRRLAADAEFRMLAKYGVFSMTAIALAHVVEYLGIHLREIPAGSKPMLIMNLYSVAFLLLVIGFEGVLATIGESSARVRDVLHAIVAVLLVLTINVFYPVGFEFTPTLTSDTLYFCMFSLLTVLTGIVVRRTVRAFPVLKPYGAHLALAVVIVYLSALPDVFMPWIVRAGIEAWRVELDAHYLVYIGLLVFYLGFERLQHFTTGLYASAVDEEEEGIGT